MQEMIENINKTKAEIRHIKFLQARSRLSLNPLCTSCIFQSIPVHPLETTIFISKLAFLASQDSSPESL